MTNILNVYNLYFYLTASELHRVLGTKLPSNINTYFEVSPRSYRLLLPKFSKEKFKSHSFVFNASKIVNYFLNNKISHYNCTNATYKALVKRHLLVRQSMSLKNDPNWLQYNLSIFSDINI